mgnify:FL=1
MIYINILDISADHDVAFDSDHGIGFQFLSIKNLVGFFAIFGWTGIALLSGGKGLGITIIISVLAGLAMMVIMATIVYYLGKLSEHNVLNLNNAKGKIGTVYLKIPAERKGMGKVQIIVQGFQTLNANAVEGENTAKIQVANSNATRREKEAEAERKAVAAEKVAQAKGIFEILGKQASGFEKLVNAANNDAQKAVMMMIAEKTIPVEPAPTPKEKSGTGKDKK